MHHTLYIVGTPLGNAADWSPRAQQVLAAAPVIAAEDTRVTARLLAHCGLSATRLLTYTCLLYTSPHPRDRPRSRMPASA